MHQPEHKTLYRVSGMTCESCEVLIEQRLSKLPNVVRVKVSAARSKLAVFWRGDEPSLDAIRSAVGTDKYRFSPIGAAFSKEHESTKRPSPWRIAGFFALAIAFTGLLSRFGISGAPTVAQGLTLGSAFILGLIAATSSCLATVGGLLLSSLANAAARTQTASSFAERIVPTFLFVAGRLFSYVLFGGLIGAIGAALSPSPFVTGGLVVLAALYMIVMGLDMLQITPDWLKRMLPKMPKSVASHMLKKGDGRHLFAPALMGVATFFVPCGFTQALQLYALTLADPLQSAALLGVFALGTSPMLLGLGFSFNLVRGKAKAFVFHFAGALIILMGFSNVQNGFAITGYPLSFDLIRSSAYPTEGNGVPSSLVPLENGVQVLRMSVNASGYSPNQFTVRAGVPAKWVVNGSRAAGCAMALSAPQLQIKKILSEGENTIEFVAPEAPGAYSFNCSMGMYRGVITVVNG